MSNAASYAEALGEIYRLEGPLDPAKIEAIHKVWDTNPGAAIARQNDPQFAEIDRRFTARPTPPASQTINAAQEAGAGEFDLRGPLPQAARESLGGGTDPEQGRNFLAGAAEAVGTGVVGGAAAMAGLPAIAAVPAVAATGGLIRMATGGSSEAGAAENLTTGAAENALWEGLFAATPGWANSARKGLVAAYRKMPPSVKRSALQKLARLAPEAARALAAFSAGTGSSVMEQAVQTGDVDPVRAVESGVTAAGTGLVFEGLGRAGGKLMQGGAELTEGKMDQALANALRRLGVNDPETVRLFSARLGNRKIDFLKEVMASASPLESSALKAKQAEVEAAIRGGVESFGLKPPAEMLAGAPQGLPDVSEATRNVSQRLSLPPEPLTLADQTRMDSNIAFMNPPPTMPDLPPGIPGYNPTLPAVVGQSIQDEAMRGRKQTLKKSSEMFGEALKPLSTIHTQLDAATLDKSIDDALAYIPNPAVGTPQSGRVLTNAATVLSGPEKRKKIVA